MTRLEWLAWRRGGIGSSDAPALVGLDPRKGPLAIYLDKVGLLPLEDGDVDEAMQWGRILEDSIADEFEKRTGLYAVGRQTQLVHSQYPFIRATLDAFVDETPDRGDDPIWPNPLGTLELKTASRLSSDWKGPDGVRVPDHVQIQVQHQLAVSGLPVAWVAVLLMFPVPKMEIIQVQRDEAAIATLLEIEAAFWQRVERREAPPADAFPATTDALRDAFPTGKVQSVELDGEGWDWLEQFRIASRELKTFEDRKALAENELKLRLGDRTAATYRGRIVVTWTSSTVERVDAKAVKAYIEKHRRSPFGKFITTSTMRRFSVKAKLATEEDEDDD